MMYMQILWKELGLDNEKGGEEKGQSPQIINFTDSATMLAFP